MRLPSLSLLRRLHESLVYSTVDALIGVPVEVQSAETALEDVLRVAREALSFTVTTMGPELVYREGAVSKYGILDTTFGLGVAPPDLPRPGLGVLRSVGLADGTESAEAQEFAGDFLRDLTLQSEAGVLHLRVFLETSPSPGPESFRPVQQLLAPLPPGFWPRRFVVKDACLTNAPSIWLAKHFYM